jgi:hypothetical protein
MASFEEPFYVAMPVIRRTIGSSRRRLQLLLVQLLLVQLLLVQNCSALARAIAEGSADARYTAALVAPLPPSLNSPP